MVVNGWNELPRGKPRGIKSFTSVDARQAAGYSTRNRINGAGGTQKTDSVGEIESVAIAAMTVLFEINISDSLANGAFVDPGFLLDQSGHQSGGAELIDAARHPLGVFEDALDRLIGEERPGGVPRDADLMFDIAEGLLQIERAEVIAHGEALIERFVHG